VWAAKEVVSLVERKNQREDWAQFLDRKERKVWLKKKSKKRERVQLRRKKEKEAFLREEKAS